MNRLRVLMIAVTLVFLVALPVLSGDIVNTIELQAGQGKSIQPHCLANTRVTVTFTNLSAVESVVVVDTDSSEEVHLDGSGSSQTRTYPCEVGAIGVKCTTGQISITVSIPLNRH